MAPINSHSGDPAALPPTAPKARSVAPPATDPPPTGSDSCEELVGSETRIPSTATTLLQWANIWIKMCADGDLALGPLPAEHARGRYERSAKQLRNIRHAATSGALRRRAQELGVPLPAGFVDHPAAGGVNGHALTTAAK